MKDHVEVCLLQILWHQFLKQLVLPLPGSASPPAEDDRREKIVYDTGVACTKLLEMNIRPKEILSFEAFENAIIMLNSVGGSTNGILHLLALASEVNIDLTL